MTPDNQTLTIRVGAADDTKAEFRQRLRAMERDEDVDDMHVLVLDSMDDVERLFRATNVELLEAIAEHEPASIREAAELVGRGHKEVLQNIDELEQLGLIDLEQDGRAKRPRTRYRKLEIEVSLPGPADGDRPATA